MLNQNRKLIETRGDPFTEMQTETFYRVGDGQGAREGEEKLIYLSNSKPVRFFGKLIACTRPR
jgi:hypothetical protein